MKNIVVALDGMTPREAIAIARKLKGKVWGFKINDLLFEDPKLISTLKKFGNVFADAKLHDIPNTVANSVARLAVLGADIITVHATGGIAMLRAAKKAARKSKIVAVSVLTSQSGDQRQRVTLLARIAEQAGLYGIVCSAREAEYLPNRIVKIVPGIRPIWYKTKDDQERTATPKQAIEAGANLLVVGRPITSAKDLPKALQLIINEINAGTA